MDTLEQEYKTFEEWLAVGRAVRKGEKMAQRRLPGDGKPVFHYNQTKVSFESVKQQPRADAAAYSAYGWRDGP